MCGFTCRESEKECSIGNTSNTMQDTNEQAHSYPIRYTVFRPCEDGLKPDGAWIEEIDESIVGQFSNCSRIVVNHMSKELLVVDEVDLSGIEHELVLNLNDDGERWQGDVLEDSPFGWGVLYDNDNRKVYEGFRIGDMNVCYGARYYSDIQKVEYEGEWYGGMRSGHGIQYNRNGEVMYDGYWMYDEHMETTVLMKERKLLHTFITSLKIEGCWTMDMCLSESFFSMLPHLELLMIGDNCFSCQNLTIKSMNNLKRIMIDNYSYRSWILYSSCKEHVHFRVVDCPQLRSIEIGNRSFLECGNCEFRNLPYLVMMKLGYHCFQWASLELRGD